MWPPRGSRARLYSPWGFCCFWSFRWPWSLCYFWSLRWSWSTCCFWCLRWLRGLCWSWSLCCFWSFRLPWRLCCFWSLRWSWSSCCFWCLRWFRGLCWSWSLCCFWSLCWPWSSCCFRSLRWFWSFRWFRGLRWSWSSCCFWSLRWFWSLCCSRSFCRFRGLCFSRRRCCCGLAGRAAEYVVQHRILVSIAAFHASFIPVPHDHDVRIVWQILVGDLTGKVTGNRIRHTLHHRIGQIDDWVARTQVVIRSAAKWQGIAVIVASLNCTLYPYYTAGRDVGFQRPDGCRVRRKEVTEEVVVPVKNDHAILAEVESGQVSGSK